MLDLDQCEGATLDKPLPAWAERFQNFKSKEAAELLGISLRQLHVLANHHGYYYAVGNQKRFSREDIAGLYAALRAEGGGIVAPLEEERQEIERARKRKAAYTGDKGYIYFIESAGFVKIGFSRSMKGRFYHIKTNSPFPVTLLCVLPGTIADEQRLHKKFAKLRERGEWFRHEGELAAHIMGLAQSK